MGAAIKDSASSCKSIIAGLRTFLLTDYTQKCLERDGERCILTKLSHPEVAHIFPYSMLNSPPPNKEWKTPDLVPKFWSLLYLFWGEDQVNKWRRKIFPNSEYPNTGVDETFNLICLTATAHEMWNQGQFALKPLELSSDNKELTVQFYWQIPNKYQPESRIDLLTEPVSSKGLDGSAGDFLALRRDSTPFIRSGEVFAFKTTDPENKPLPSMELLTMQWYLQRLVAMSGAAGWPRLDWNDDDDTITCPNPSYADGNVNTTFQDVYEWLPSPLPPISSQVGAATYAAPIEVHQAWTS